MNITRLAVREIRHRKANFLLSALSVLAAVATVVIALTVLGRYEYRTRCELWKLNDDYRKITKTLGFNVIIVPKNQKLGDFYADDGSTEYMPESYVTKLSTMSVMTINHLLPTIQKKMTWPERGRKILLVGTRGEVPISHRDPKKPLLDRVKPGTIVMGHDLHWSMELKVDDEVTLSGRKFKIVKCQEKRGSKDDITVWINLAEAQEMLGKQGEINAIRALSCHCKEGLLVTIKVEIQQLLPDTRVIIDASKAIARARARTTAADHAKRTLAEQRTVAVVLVSVVVVACVMSIVILTILNVRDRQGEIGVLRALGTPSSKVLVLFLTRALLVGVIGAFAGFFVGLAGSLLFSTPAVPVQATAKIAAPTTFDFLLLLFVILLAPLFTAVASWVPALWASLQDPALVLREE